jgi:benzodiazapine receptor
MVDVITIWLSAFIALITAWPGFYIYTGKVEKFYNSGLKHVKLPPAWLFGVVWTAMYGIIAAAEILHTLSVDISGTRVSSEYLATVIMFLINISMNHYWTIAFFRMRQSALALVLSIMLVLTAIPIIILYAIQELLASALLFAVYTCWLVVALIFTGLWISFVPKQKKEY